MSDQDVGVVARFFVCLSTLDGLMAVVFVCELLRP